MPTESTPACHSLVEERSNVSNTSLFTYQNIIHIKLIFSLNTEAIQELKLNYVHYFEDVLPYSFCYLTWETNLGEQLCRLCT